MNQVIENITELTKSPSNESTQARLRLLLSYEIARKDLNNHEFRLVIGTSNADERY